MGQVCPAATLLPSLQHCMREAGKLIKGSSGMLSYDTVLQQHVNQALQNALKAACSKELLAAWVICCHKPVHDADKETDMDIWCSDSNLTASSIKETDVNLYLVNSKHKASADHLDSAITKHKPAAINSSSCSRTVNSSASRHGW